MAQLFISHIHEEARVAEEVARFLKYSGLEVFLSSDHWQIRAGERWFDRIIGELTEAKVAVLLLSEDSVRRPWINFEAGWAWSAQKPVLPLCIGKLTKGRMPRPYSDLQGLDLKSDYYDLVKDCDAYLGRLSPPPFVRDDPNVAKLLAELGDFERREMTPAG